MENRIKVFDLRIMNLRCGFGGLGSLVFIRRLAAAV
jgi:hypothetical protein